ncbi:MAG: type IV secretion system DNA-binding domain-containing protein [Patescibacteria group bacterium]|nr:type IV secretion system DNA-binding domain-containing protein [Patescibacteria group bacterium]
MANNEITYFAKTTFRRGEQVFGIRRADRRHHIYVVGKTGVGKTALLKNMALQDIQKGEGVAIVDPHGEFAEEVLDRIPSERLKDVIYFNPADIDYPIAFNILGVPDPKYKHLIASGLIGIFTKIWANVWSARMEYILSNCILALLDTPKTTLLGILRLLVDRDYRQKIVNNIQDPVVKSFWVNEYEEWGAQYRNEAIAPIQNKVGQFLNVSLIRNIVGQSKSTLDIPEIMDTGKILLVNVSKGRIGEDNSALLGAMLITKIQLAAMERVRIPEEQRRDFYLYVDEFQNFATESFTNILSEARKYHLNLVIAHQYIGQLITQTTTEVRDAVFGNVGTLICFRIGAADAEFLEREFEPEFTVQDLVNLPNFNIYLKLMIDGITSRPFSAQTLPPVPKEKTKSQREKIIKFSRERYSNPRVEVEERIARWSGVLEFPTTPPPSPSGLYDAKCSLCGKKTKVIFPPDKERPVYCKTCLKKVERGEVEVPSRPSRVQPQKAGRERQETAPELADLGIEFSSSSVEKTKLFPQETEVKKKTPSQISLEEAIKKTPESFRKKKEVDTKGLRETLREIFKKPKEEKKEENSDK